jgi:hypothetical protein
MIALSALLVLTAAACGGGADPAATTTTLAPTTTALAPTTTVTTTTLAPTTTVTTTTLAPTTTEASAAVEPAEVVPGADADVDAVVEAYAIVFDSTTTYEEKVPYLVEPEGLEDTVAEYAETGEQFGGVSVEATGVSIDGDAAVISYSLLFGGNPTYTDLRGDAVRTDAGWQITRAMFCSLMTSARVGCPSA